MSKYKGMEFPFYGLKEKPFDIKFDVSKIEIKINESDYQWRVLDDKSLQGDYFFRQVQMLSKKYTKVHFKYTCRNLREVINSKCKWGVDSTAQIYDLSTKQKFKLICNKIKKIKENLIWVEEISYPFEINTDNINIQENYYVTLVNIDKRWYPLEFSFSKHNRIATHL
tara:strand:+ start:517 stop:1020 length:504 start_codon:yes stop_codon:yes gene_type:complete